MGERSPTQTVTQYRFDDSGMVQAIYRTYFVGGDYAGPCRGIEGVEKWLTEHCEQIHGSIAVNITISQE